MPGNFEDLYAVERGIKKKSRAHRSNKSSTDQRSSQKVDVSSLSTEEKPTVTERLFFKIKQIQERKTRRIYFGLCILSYLGQEVQKPKVLEKPNSTFPDVQLTDFPEQPKPYFSLLGFWAKHQKKFPELAQIAKMLLAIPATTSTAESDSSIFGKYHEKRRTRLSTERMQSMMVLRYNRAGTLDDLEDRA